MRRVAQVGRTLHSVHRPSSKSTVVAAGVESGEAADEHAEADECASSKLTARDLLEDHLRVGVEHRRDQDGEQRGETAVEPRAFPFNRSDSRLMLPRQAGSRVGSRPPVARRCFNQSKTKIPRPRGLLETIQGPTGLDTA